MPRRPADQPVARHAGLRTAAVIWGGIVLVGHVATWHDIFPEMLLHYEPIDVVKHLTGVGVFTLLYRASWPPRCAGWNASLASLAICCGWGALCETLQLLTPLRTFMWQELALNTLSPALIVGLWWLVEQVWER
jgi:hypothetical protein